MSSQDDVYRRLAAKYQHLHKDKDGNLRREGNAPAFRLAFRDEGDFWNCYFAGMETMDDAILIGSIRMSLIEIVPALHQGFLDMMRAVFDQLVQNITGARPAKWTPGPGPEHERTKGGKH